VGETRKLAAILVSDVVGYSRLTGADEDRILARLRALRSDLLDPTIAVHHGLEYQADIRLRPRLMRPQARRRSTDCRPPTPISGAEPLSTTIPRCPADLKAPKSFSAINRKPESDRLLGLASSMPEHLSPRLMQRRQDLSSL
jgi:class 3 adenylate cyclase